MYPFLTAISERFGYEKHAAVPIVEATGTGGGLKFFCSSSNFFSPSLVAASRPMSDKEKAFCQRNGVTSFFEIPLGLDGIVLVKPRTSPLKEAQGSLGPAEAPPLTQDLPNRLTLKELYQAVAHPRGQPKEALPQLWSDIRPLYARIPIKILAPSTSSGTREAFENLVLKGVTARQGRAFKSAADQEAVLVQKLLKTRDALAIISFAYLEKNREVLKALSLNNVDPTRETIREKKYPLVRRVYLYAKGNHFVSHPTLKPFLQYLISPEINRLLAENGLVPLKNDLQERRQRALETFIESLADQRKAIS